MQFIPAKDDWADAFRSLGSTVSQSYVNRADENALRKSIEGLGENASARDILDAITNTKTYSPKAKQTALKNYMGVQEFEEAKRKAKELEAIAKEKNTISQEKNRIAAIGKGTIKDIESRRQNYIAAGYPAYQANILVDPNTTPGEKQQIAAEHKELVGRGIRKPLDAQPNPQESVEEQIQLQEPQKEDVPLQEVQQAALEVQPVVSESKPTAKETKNEWPKVEPPKDTTFAEKEKWRSSNQKENNKLLKETKEKTKSHKNALIRFNRLKSLNESKKIPDGKGRLLINPSTGEPYAVASLLGVVNKETQDFVKTMNDFLIDAKTYFGSRVTNFDVSSFKSRLPSLMNTEDGRRLIIEQMKLMEELQIVHDEELESALKHYGRNASYSDIQRIVDDRTVQKEMKIINKLNSLDDASNNMDMMSNDPKFKDMALMQNPSGKFVAVPKSKVASKEEEGYIAW